MEQLCFGVDIGGTTIKAGLFNQDGMLLNKWEFPTKKSDIEKEFLWDTAIFIESMIRERKLDRNGIIGIGVGLPGPVMENGEVLELSNLGTGYFNIINELQEMTGLKVKAGNDANVAALGELWQGSGKGYKSMVLVTLGTGVGGGIIYNNDILAGSKGAAGEIGHICVNEKEKITCGCGKKGCLEQYASATGIVRLAREALARKNKQSKLYDKDQLNAKVIFDLAKEGDVLSLEIVEDACRYLGIALAQVAQVVDPEVFVIGGGVSKAGSILTERVKEHYNSHVMDALKDKEFRIAALGNDAGIYGGARLILSSNA